MAMAYQNFASLGVNLNRQKYGPLDISNVFTSAADLKYYLTKGTFTEGVSEYWYKNANEKIVPYPYEGQVLATVIDGVVSVYALSLDAEGNFQTQEIGAKVEVDGKTIKLNAAGKLELVGIPADIAGKTLVPSLVNGELTWAEPDTSTAEGQAQEIEGLKTRATALEETVNGKGEGESRVPGLVEKVAALEAVDNATQAELDAYKEVVTKAISDAVADVKKYADDNDADTIYDDSDLQTRVKALEDEERYDDTEVRELIADLDDAIGDAEGGLVKDIADNKAAIEAEVSRATAKEAELAQAIAAIDFINQDELDAALEPINTALGTKAAQTDLEALEDRVDAFLTGSGATDALDSLQELITYINTHDDADINGILASIQAIEDKLAGIDSTVVAYVTAAIDALKIGDYAKASDLTALAGRVEALEGKPFDTYATKSEVEAVDAKFADYTKTSDLNTSLAGKVNTSDFETFKGENTTAIGAAKDAAIAAAKTETANQVGALEGAVAETYATKTALTEAVEGIENDLLVYAKTADVNAELAKKIETGSIAHSSESLTEGVTVEGTKLNIVVDAYTKQEVRDYVADVIEDMTGGESAADVLLALNNHIDTYTEKVGQIDAKDAAQDTAITKAQEDATKGINDAAKVAADLVTANTAIADNTREIGVAKSSIETVNTTLTEKITALENADTKFTGDITSLQGIVSGEGGHASRITALEGRATNLETRDTELAALIQGNTDKFKDYSTTAQMNSAIEAAIAGADLSTYAKVTDVEAIYKAGVDGRAATGVLAEEIARATAAEKVNSDAIAALVGDDAGKTIRTIAGEETAKIVAGADAKYDTLKEFADFIINDETGAAAMANNISALKTTVGDAESGLVKAVADNAAAIAAIVQPKGSVEVTVADDGTLGLGQVSTDKLVMGSDTLVIDGGKAV